MDKDWDRKLDGKREKQREGETERGRERERQSESAFGAGSAVSLQYNETMSVVRGLDLKELPGRKDTIWSGGD